MPYPWRIVEADCPISPADRVLHSGTGTVHEAMSVAYALRLEYGPEVGLGVEWLKTTQGMKWERYCFLTTDQQRAMSAEMDRRAALARRDAYLAKLKIPKVSKRRK